MKKAKNHTIAAMGVLLFLFGLYLAKTTDSPQVFLTALPYVCIGIGSGAFGYGISNIISDKRLSKNPAMQKQLAINKNDERTITIISRAKAKAYDLIIFVFGALIFAFILMGVAVLPSLLFILAWLFAQGYAIYYRCKYEKEL